MVRMAKFGRYASGESNGGMQTYQLGVDLATRLAAISPEFGSFHRGFAMAPPLGVPLLDLHGKKDTTVPANACDRRRTSNHAAHSVPAFLTWCSLRARLPNMVLASCPRRCR